MNLANLAKMFSFCIKYLTLNSKFSKYRFKVFPNETKFQNLNFDIFKGFLILTEFENLVAILGKFSSLNFGKKTSNAAFQTSTFKQLLALPFCTEFAQIFLIIFQI